MDIVKKRGFEDVVWVEVMYNMSGVCRCVQLCVQVCAGVCRCVQVCAGVCSCRFWRMQS